MSYVKPGITVSYETSANPKRGRLENLDVEALDFWPGPVLMDALGDTKLKKSLLRVMMKPIIENQRNK